MSYKDNLSLIRQMLEISGSLDIETVGLRAGAGIHEVSYGVFGKGAIPGDVTQYITEPSSIFSVSESGELGPYKPGKTPFESNTETLWI